MKNFKNTLLQISHAGMGSGDETLGLQLITNYLKLLNDEPEMPGFIVLYNGGVKLVCKDSPVVEILREMEKKGVKLIACTTCLRHFDILDKVEAGIAGSMMDILELQGMADKVIGL